MRSHPAPSFVVALLLSLSTLFGSASGQVPDHLKCYRLKDAAAPARYAAAIATRDPADFPTEAGCFVRTPAALLCVAARQVVISPATAGALAGQPSQDYLCYKMKCPRNQPTLTLTDQFGSHPLRVTRSDLYCTPVCSACDGGCADLQNDAANCGACGNVCAPGVACTAGSCGGTGPTTSSTSTTDMASTSTTSTTSTSSTEIVTTSTTSTSTTVTVTSSSTTSTTTPAPGAVCQIAGLFHMITFDGLRFDVVAAGVFSLVDSAALTVQVNAGPVGPVYAANGVALRYGTTIMIYDTTHGLTGSTDPSGIVVLQTAQSVEFSMDDGSQVNVQQVTSLDNVQILDVEVALPATAMARVSGLCGNFDGNESNDNLAPDGQTIPLTPDGTALALTWIPDSTANLFVTH
jgi:VWD domain-containing protein